MTKKHEKRERRKIGGYDFPRLLKGTRTAAGRANAALRAITNANEQGSLTDLLLALHITDAALAINQILLALPEIESIADHSTKHIEQLEQRIERITHQKGDR